RFDPAGTGRLDAGPRHREPVPVQPGPGQQVQVLPVAVVVVAGDVTGLAVDHPSGRMAERVPDGRPASVLLDRALDLVSGRGRTPDEVTREAGFRLGQRRF